jgi:hypothetical protein
LRIFSVVRPVSRRKRRKERGNAFNLYQIDQAHKGRLYLVSTILERKVADRIDHDH